MWYQQGDVKITKINKLPVSKDSVVKQASGEFVLAYGEATGHSHTVELNQFVQGFVFERRTLPKMVFIVADEQFEVRHQTHGSIWVEPGVYRVEAGERDGIQEWDHFGEDEQRAVID